MNRALLAIFLLAFTGPAVAQVEAELARAQGLIGDGRFDEAEAAFREMLDRYPALIDAHDGLATALERQGRRREALRWLLEAGQELVRAGDLDPGTRFLERAVGLDSELSSAHAALGHAYLQGQRYRAAETHLRRSVELGETSPMARLYLAAALWELGEYDRAEAVYGELLGFAGPSAAAARRSLGALHVFRGDFDKAIPLLGAALGESAGSVQVRYDLACALEGAGRVAEAIELYVKTLEDAPDFLQAHYRLARLYRAGGRAEQATRHLERFSELHAEHQARTREEGRLEARLKQAWSLLRENRVEAARKLFASLPPGPESLRGLAQAAYASGDPAAAIATLESVLAAEPERLDLRLLLDEWRVEAARR